VVAKGDKTKDAAQSLPSALLSGLSREASTKRRSGISGISNTVHGKGLLLNAFARFMYSNRYCNLKSSELDRL